MKTKMEKYRAYLGKFFNYWNKVTPNDIENFKSYNIDKNGSYLVIGGLEALNKFIFLFIMQKYYNYEFHTLSDYIFDFSKEESNIIGSELLIISNYSDYSKSEKMKDFILTSLSSTIIDRNVNEEQTIILSTMRIPEIEKNCHDFMSTINLTVKPKSILNNSVPNSTGDETEEHTNSKINSDSSTQISGSIVVQGSKAPLEKDNF